MADYQQLGDAFLQLTAGEELIPGDLGMTVGGTFLVVDPDDPRRFFVRFPNGTFVSALHKNRVLQRPGTPVLVGKDSQGNPVITGIDPTRANAFFSNSGGGGGDVGLHDHVRNSGREYVTDPWLIKRLRTTVTSGFVVQVDDGAYLYNRILTWWDADTIDLSAYVPTNSVYDRWVIVGIDPISNVLVAVAGDEYFPTTIYDPTQIDLIAFTQLGYIPCAAVYIRGTNTSIPNYQIEDLRFAPGSLISYLGDLVDVNTDYAEVGDVLTFDGTEWVAAEPTGGSSGGLSLGGGTSTKKFAADGSEIITQVVVQPTVVVIPLENDVVAEIVGVRIYNRYGITRTITNVFAAVDTPPDGDDIIVDVLKNGVSIHASPGDAATILDGANTGETETFDDASWLTNEYLQIEVLQVGSTTPGSDLSVHIAIT